MGMWLDSLGVSQQHQPRRLDSDTCSSDSCQLILREIPYFMAAGMHSKYHPRESLVYYSVLRSATWNTRTHTCTYLHLSLQVLVAVLQW